MLIRLRSVNNFTYYIRYEAVELVKLVSDPKSGEADLRFIMLSGKEHTTDKFKSTKEAYEALEKILGKEAIKDLGT
jgi:hypothetical protein